MSLKIVYLDDEPDLCDIFKESIENDRFQVTTFVDPERAVKSMEASPPDIFFVDFRLPNITGDKVAERLPREITKILVTGDLSVASEASFIKVFHKPFNFDEIEAFLQGFEKNKGTA